MADRDGQERVSSPPGRNLTMQETKVKLAKSAEINSLAVFGSGLVIIYLMKGFLGEKNL